MSANTSPKCHRMPYKHCSPCDNFAICACCEQEICVTCNENFDSIHMILTDQAHQKLTTHRKAQELMPAGLCRECLFYAHHDINNPDQETYDENTVYEVEQKEIEVVKPYRGKVIETQKSIKKIGKKPKRTSTTRKGPFYFPPQENQKNL